MACEGGARALDTLNAINLAIELKKTATLKAILGSMANEDGCW